MELAEELEMLPDFLRTLEVAVDLLSHLFRQGLELGLPFFVRLHLGDRVRLLPSTSR